MSEAPAVVDAHGAIEILDGPAVLVVEPPEEIVEDAYTGRTMTCRKPFKLAGKRYRKGDPVPVDLIPRVDSWIHTGFLEAARAS